MHTLTLLYHPRFAHLADERADQALYEQTSGNGALHSNSRKAPARGHRSNHPPLAVLKGRAPVHTASEHKLGSETEISANSADTSKHITIPWGSPNEQNTSP